MKRLICFLVMVTLMIPSVGIASGVDVASLDDAALESLLDAVLTERLARRQFTSFLVEKGEYRVGIDVPAGAFRVVHEGSSYITGIKVFGTSDDKWPTFSAQVANEDDEGSSTTSVIGRVVLPDGAKLVVDSGSARFYVETGGVTFE